MLCPLLMPSLSCPLLCSMCLFFFVSPCFVFPISIRFQAHIFFGIHCMYRVLSCRDPDYYQTIPVILAWPNAGLFSSSSQFRLNDFEKGNQTEIQKTDQRIASYCYDDVETCFLFHRICTTTSLVVLFFCGCLINGTLAPAYD